MPGSWRLGGSECLVKNLEANTETKALTKSTPLARKFASASRARQRV